MRLKSNLLSFAKIFNLQIMALTSKPAFDQSEPIANNVKSHPEQVGFCYLHNRFYTNVHARVPLYLSRLILAVIKEIGF